VLSVLIWYIKVGFVECQREICNFNCFNYRLKYKYIKLNDNESNK